MQIHKLNEQDSVIALLNEITGSGTIKEKNFEVRQNPDGLTIAVEGHSGLYAVKITDLVEAVLEIITNPQEDA